MFRPRTERKPEPEIPEHIEAGHLDRAARRELLTLSKENADGVARHLVAATEALAEEDLASALAHAENASRRAGRVAIVREVLGFVHYRRAEWAEALREFRTARRISGSHHLMPHMADVERGLGRPDRAIELATEPGADALSAADRVELAIVVSGARRDLGQDAAAVQSLRELVQASPAERSWAPRLYYAYAEALLGTGDETGAREWFARAVDADGDALTDASDRLAELDGIDITDFGGDDEDAEASAFSEDDGDTGYIAPVGPGGGQDEDNLVDGLDEDDVELEGELAPKSGVGEEPLVVPEPEPLHEPESVVVEEPVLEDMENEPSENEPSENKPTVAEAEVDANADAEIEERPAEEEESQR